MPSLVVKVSKIAHSPNGAQEPFELTYDPTGLEGFKGLVEVKGHFLRVEEGILMVMEELKATQKTPCVRCGKELTITLPFEESEWLFYENKPLAYDDENELLFIDRRNWEVDPSEAIRQELLLNGTANPHCTKDCAHFEEPRSEEEGVRALSALKDLLK